MKSLRSIDSIHTQKGRLPIPYSAATLFLFILVSLTNLFGQPISGVNNFSSSSILKVDPRSYTLFGSQFTPQTAKAVFRTGEGRFKLEFITFELQTNASFQTKLNVNLSRRIGNSEVPVGSLAAPFRNPTPAAWNREFYSGPSTVYVDYFPTAPIVLEPKAEYTVDLSLPSSPIQSSVILLARTNTFTGAPGWALDESIFNIQQFGAGTIVMGVNVTPVADLEVGGNPVLPITVDSPRWLSPTQGFLERLQKYELKVDAVHPDLSVVFQIVNGGAQLQSNVLTPTRIGSVTVAAYQYVKGVYSGVHSVRTWEVKREPPQPQIIYPDFRDLYILAQSAIGLISYASSGLPLTYEVVSGPASVKPEWSQLILNGAGKVTLRLSQAGDANWLPASMLVEFEVLKDRPTLAEPPVLSWSTPDTTALLRGERYTLQIISLLSGLPVEYAIVFGPAKLEGNQLIPFSLGPVEVRASVGTGSKKHSITRLFIVTDLFSPNLAWEFPEPGQRLEINKSYVLRVSTQNPGDPVDFQLLEGSALLESGILKITNGGPVRIRASQPGTDFFLPGSVQQTWKAGLDAELNWVLPASSNLVVGKSYPLSLVTSHCDSPVVYSVTAGKAMIRGAEVTPLVTGELRIQASQAGNRTFMPVSEERRFSVLPATLVADWIEPVSNFVPLHVPNLLRVALKDFPKEEPVFRVEEGPGVLVGNLLTITNSGPVWVSVSLSGEHGLSSRRLLNPESVLTSRGLWPGHAEGPFRDLEVKDKLMYVAMGRGGLGIFELDGAGGQRRIGGIDLPGFANELQIVGNHAFVATVDSGMQILDVKDPLKVRRIGEYRPSGNVVGLSVTNGVAYVAAFEGGTHLVDVTTPGSPVLLSVLPSLGFPQSVRVQDGRAYITAELAGLEIFDVSDAKSPQRLGRFGGTNSYSTVHLFGQRALITAWKQGAVILDVSDPKAPVDMATVPARGESVRGWVDGSSMYLAEYNGGVTVYDISDPYRPLLKHWFGQLKAAMDVLVHGDQIYVALDSSGLGILSKKYLPPQVFPTFSLGGGMSGLTIGNNLTFVAAGQAGLRIVDMQDSDKPRLLSELSLDGYAGRVSVSSNLACVTLDNRQLAFVDCSDPTNPSQVGRFSGFATFQQTVLKGVYAYSAVWNDGLAILDISHPESPSFVGQVLLPGATDVAVAGDFAYVAANTAGLYVVNVSSPQKPRVAGFLALTGKQRAVSVFEGMAAVATETNGVYFMDVSDPAAPRMLGNLATAGTAVDVVLRKGMAWIAESTGGLLSVDISDPSRPLLAQSIDFPDACWSVDVSGSTLGVVREEWGLQLLDCQPRRVQLIEPKIPKTITLGASPLKLEGLSNSGLELKYEIRSGNARIENSTLIPTGLGKVELAVIQEGNESFLPATQQLNLEVLLRPQVLSWVQPVPTHLDVGASIELSAMASTSLPITYAVASGPATISGNRLTITGPGKVVIEAVQAGNHQFERTTLTENLNLTFVNFVETGRWRDPAVDPTGLFKDGTRLFTTGNGLHCFDITDPVNPLLTGVYSSGLRTTKVFVTNDVAYLLVVNEGLRILDVRDPSNIQELSRWASPLANLSITVGGGHAYIGQQYFEKLLKIVNVEDVRKPVFVAEINAGVTEVSDITLIGNTLVMATDSSGLVFYDVSRPSAPKLLSRLLGEERITSIRIEKDLAYVTAGISKFFIVDVRSPSTPVEVARVSRILTAGFSSSVVRGQHLVLADYHAREVSVFDVSNPGKPSYISRLFVDTPVAAMEISGDYILAASDTAGLRVLHLSSAGRLTMVNSGEPSGNALGVRVSPEGFAFVASDISGLQILDVRNPGNIRRLSRFPTQTPATVVELYQSTAFLGSSDLDIINVSDPSKPVLLSRISKGGRINAMAVSENYAFVGGASRDLRVIDFSRPQQAALVAVLNLDFPLDGLAIAGKHLLATSNNGILILDVSNPLDPRKVGEWQSPDFLEHIKVHGNLAYVSGDASASLVLDVTTPTAPKLLSTLSGPTWGGKFIPFDQRVLQVRPSLSVYDVADPEHPMLLGLASGNFGLVDADRLGNRVVSAAADLGVVVYDMREGQLQSLVFEDPGNRLLTSPRIRLQAKASSGLPVRFSVLLGPGRIEGQDLLLTGEGELVIRADQDGDSRFLPASTARRISSSRAPQTLSSSLTPGSTLPVATTVDVRPASNSGLPVQLELAEGPAQIEGHNLTPTNKGPVRLIIRQPGNETHAPAFLEIPLNVELPSLQKTAVWPGYLRGPSQDVALSEKGDKLYVALGTGLGILDVAAASPTSLISTFRPDGVRDSANRILSRNNVVYLGYTFGLLVLVDVSNPSMPVEISRINLRQINGMVLGESTLFVASSSFGMQSVDVSNPKEPRLLWTGSLMFGATKIALDGSILLLANSTSGPALFDVRNPAHPVLLSFLPYGGFITDGSLADGFAYLAAGSGTMDVHVFDVRDPIRPRRVPGALGKVENSAIARGKLMIRPINNGKGVEIWDFSDPAKPRNLASVPVPGIPVGMVARESTIYLACNSGGTVRVTLKSGGGSSSENLLSLDGFAYDLADLNGRWVVADGVNGLPILAKQTGGKVELLGKLSTSASVISVAGNAGHVLAARNNDTLITSDFSDPKLPVIVENSGLSNVVRLVRWSGNFAVASGSQGEAYRVDMTSPQKPVVLKIASLSEQALSAVITPDGRHVVLGSSDMRVYTITSNIQGGFSGVQTARISTGTSVMDLVVQDQLLYAAVGTNGLQVYQFANPNQPTLATSIKVEADVRKVQVNGNFVFLGDQRQRLLVLDMKSFKEPAVVAGVDLPDHANRIAVRGNQLLVATGNTGVQLYTFSPSTNQPAATFAEWFSRRYPTLPLGEVGLEADPDGDHVPNGLEILMGTNPEIAGAEDGRIPIPVLNHEEKEPGVEIPLRIDPEADAWLEWTLEHSSSLDTPDWQAVPRVVLEKIEEGYRVRLPATAAARYFRLQLKPRQTP